MHNLGIVEWTDERINDNYPLARPCPMRDVLVDASFIQFDGYVPVLESVTIDPGVSLTLNVRVSGGLVSFAYGPGDTGKSARLGGYHIGTVVVSPTILQSYLSDRPSGTTRLNIPFHPATVLSVPSSTGVFELGGLVGGGVHFVSYIDRHAPVPTVQFTDQDGVFVMSCGFPASLNESSGKLKTINGLSPTSNNITIAPSDLLKVDSISGGLKLSVASGADVAAIAPKARYA